MKFSERWNCLRGSAISTQSARCWPLMPARRRCCPGSNSPAKRDLMPLRVLLMRDEAEDKTQEEPGELRR